MDKYQSDARASIGGMRGMGGGGGRMRGAPVRHAKDFKGTCKMLWYFMGSLKYWLFLVVGIAAAVSGLGVAIPILVGKIVDAMGLAAGQADFALRIAAVCQPAAHGTVRQTAASAAGLL